MHSHRNSENRTWLLSLLAVSSLALSQLACNPSAPDTSISTNTPKSVEQTAPSTPKSTATPPSTRETEAEQATTESAPPAEPGMACVGSFGYGLTCLNETGWRTFSEDNSPLGSDLITEISVCPDGSLLVAHSSGISRFDRETWKEYERGWGYSSIEAMACDAAGGIWVAHFGGVSHYDGRAWSTHPSEQLATGEAATDLIQDVAVAPGGRVWVVTANSAAMLDSLDGDEWTIFQPGQGFSDQYFLDKIALDAQGHPWIAHSGGLLTFDDGAWTAYSNYDLPIVESIAMDAQGRVWIGTMGEGLYLFQDGSWSVYNNANSELKGNHVHAIVADAQDRVWLGTEWGLYVFDGANWQPYRMDNADLADNDIYALAVVQAGPSLPEPTEKTSGSMNGRVVLEDGQPVAGATVEICIGMLGNWFYGETPCADQSFIRRTETDADGHFAIYELPVGFYVLAVNTGDNWTQLATDLGFSSERILVEAGQETYVGELVVGSTSTPVPPTPTQAPTATPEPMPTLTPRPSLFRPVIPIEDVIPGIFERLQATSDGTLWLITDRGVARLLNDGWTVYLTTDSAEQVIGADAYGRVWAIRDFVDTNQISAWDGASWTVFGADEGWTPLDAAQTWNAWGAIGDASGRLWFTTSQDVRVFDGKHWTVFTPEDMGMAALDHDSGVEHDFGITVLRSNGHVWVRECEWTGPGPFGGLGVRWFDGQAWHGADSPVASGCAAVIKEDGAGRVWLGVDTSLYRHDPTSGEWVQFEPTGEEPLWDVWYFRQVTDVILDPSSGSWATMLLCSGASCDTSAVYHARDAAWIQVTDDPSCSPILVLDEDNVGWVLCWDGPVHRIAGGALEPVPGETVPGLHSGIVHAAGRLWLMAWHEGRETLWTFDTRVPVQ